MLLMEAAFFDLDKTLISRASSFAMAGPMYREGWLSRRALARGVFAQLTFILIGADERRLDRAKEAMLKITRGWEQAQVERLAREVVVDVIDPFIYAEAVELILEHRREGRPSVIVSSSPEEIVRPIAAHVGADHVIATRAEVVDGRYTGRVERYCVGAEKASAIRVFADEHHIDLDGSYAYSDSHSDLPMLEAVGHPVAVNPSTELRRVAEARGWPVLHFHRQVRESVVNPGRIAIVAGAIVVAGAAVWFGIRRFRRLASGSGEE